MYPRRKQAKLPREALDGGKEMTVRSDLESIGVQICSVEVSQRPSSCLTTGAEIDGREMIAQVPPLFTENFDYQFFYPGFVNGILTSDLLGKTICCTVLGEEVETTEKSVTSSRAVEWAAVVGNTKSYDMIRFVSSFSPSHVPQNLRQRATVNHSYPARRSRLRQTRVCRTLSIGMKRDEVAFIWAKI